MRSSEGEENKKRAEKNNGRNNDLAKNINLQIPEAQQTLSKINTNKCTPRHSMLKWLKAKGKILKAVGEK